MRPCRGRPRTSAGVTPEGAPVVVDLDARRRPVLLVFLSTHCDGCDLFWRGAGTPPPAGVDVVVVTKGPGQVVGRARSGHSPQGSTSRSCCPTGPGPTTG